MKALLRSGGPVMHVLDEMTYEDGRRMLLCHWRTRTGDERSEWFDARTLVLVGGK